MYIDAVVSTRLPVSKNVMRCKLDFKVFSFHSKNVMLCKLGLKSSYFTQKYKSYLLIGFKIFSFHSGVKSNPPNPSPLLYFLLLVIKLKKTNANFSIL